MEINTIKKTNSMEINTNGHAYVDLGLPSGTLWAKCNVGAKKETDVGLYFAWGETQGYTASQVPSKKKFDWNDYQYGTDGTSCNLTKYNAIDGLTKLELSDDAAAINMGGVWRMPTKAQCEELFNAAYVINAWITNYQGSGVSGRLFTSLSNGNTLFFPTTGRCFYGCVSGTVCSSNVWLSSLNEDTDYAYDAWSFIFGSDEAFVDGYNFRCGGRSVRGVISK